MPCKLYSIPDAIELLNSERGKLDLDDNNVDYWGMLKVLNIDMCILMVNRDNPDEDAGWDALKKNFKRIWQKAGSEGDKLAEMEHIKILIYALIKVYKAREVGLLPHKKTATIEDLNFHLDTLKSALANLKHSKPKNTKK